MITTLLALVLAVPAQQSPSDAQIVAWIADDLRRDSRATPQPAAARFSGAGHTDDLAIARVVSSRLVGAGAHGIIVGVSGGEVRLHGHVADEAARQRALQLAADVQGVHGVTNLMLLPGEEPAPPAPAPAAQDAEPQATMAAPPAEPIDFLTTDGLAGRGLLVSVKDGVATLTGAVNSEAAQRYATDAAQRVPGVRAVRGALTVRRADPVADRRLAVLVQRALEYDVIVQTVSNALLVTVDHGVVRLTGKVRDEGQRAQAAAVAGGVGGVFAVSEELVVDENLYVPADGRIPGFKEFRDR